MTASITFDSAATPKGGVKAAIRFRPFSQAGIDLIKAVPNHRWDSQQKRWLVPAHRLPQLLPKLHATGLAITVAGKPWAPPPAPEPSADDQLVILFRALPEQLRQPTYLALAKTWDEDNDWMVRLHQAQLGSCISRLSPEGGVMTGREYVSPYMGVYRTRNKVNPWAAYMTVAGKQRHLGVFRTQGQAAIAVWAARLGTQGRRRCSTIITEKGRSWAEVAVTKGQWSLVDVADLDLVEGYAWSLGGRGDAYAVRREGRRRIFLHRLVLGLAPDDPRDVDHISHQTLDNRRSNLRIATRSENLANQAKTGKPTTSRFKGVSWFRRDQKWRASIRGQHLGYFDTEVEAARAYNAAAGELYGEFAWLNQVPRRLRRRAS